ncbi:MULTISPECIES: helix-turn-helix domain-containing protein [Providencia]|uniref:helix-turn-helix domain-containing protein n=1 Tax=Providencia TaxID=586 RepID=UPI0023490253|nr:helix-turn-helix transcriptional regulator [Providencia sp. PROV143]
MQKTTQRNKNLGEYIRNIRVNKKISDHKMADSLNITDSHYNEYESGNTSIYADHLIIISKIFNIHINVFLNVYLRN